MKTFKRSFTQISANTPKRICNTKAYKQKIENIKAELTSKYDERLKGERNMLKRVVLLLKKRMEINRAIRELTSSGKLYLAVTYVK